MLTGICKTHRLNHSNDICEWQYKSTCFGLRFIDEINDPKVGPPANDSEAVRPGMNNLAIEVAPRISGLIEHCPGRSSVKFERAGLLRRNKRNAGIFR